VGNDRSGKISGMSGKVGIEGVQADKKGNENENAIKVSLFICN
jgi:hypothetical protein